MHDIPSLKMLFSNSAWKPHTKCSRDADERQGVRESRKTNPTEKIWADLCGPPTDAAVCHGMNKKAAFSSYCFAFIMKEFLKENKSIHLPLTGPCTIVSIIFYTLLWLSCNNLLICLLSISIETLRLELQLLHSRFDGSARV